MAIQNYGVDYYPDTNVTCYSSEEQTLASDKKKKKMKRYTIQIRKSYLSIDPQPFFLNFLASAYIASLVHPPIYIYIYIYISRQTTIMTLASI